MRRAAGQWVVVAFLACLSACASDVDLADPDAGGDGAKTSCAGALGREPRVIATGLAEGILIVAGERLVLAERESGRVLAIERCTGETELLAELDGKMRSAVAREDAVYAVTSGQGAKRLWRVALAGGAPLPVVDLPPAFADVAAHASGVYGMMPTSAGAEPPEGDATQDFGLFAVDEQAGALTLLHAEEVADPSASVLLVGTSDAGLYVRQRLHCDCTGLERTPFAGGALLVVPGTEGAEALAAVGPNLFVAAAGDSAKVDLVRLPLEGGAREVLLAHSDEHLHNVKRIVANEGAVCWATSDPWGEPAPPRCLGLAAGAAVRVLGGEADLASTLVAARDAVYWLRVGTEGFDLVGAIP